MGDGAVKWRAMFAGWQGGVLAVGCAAYGLLLAVPHAVEPRELPAPEVDEVALARSLDDEEREAREFARAPAAYDVRRVGEAYRRYGDADRAGSGDALAAARQALLAAVTVAAAGGPAPLLALRSYEQARFLDGLASWEATGAEPPELAAVGGDFVGLATRSGWVDGRRLLCDRGVRAALFKRRFAEVTGLKEHAFDPPLDQSRALYRFYFAHPPAGAGRGAWSWLARKADELAALDPTYPASLARGVAWFQLGRTAEAAVAFHQHLAAHPSGPYTLRARNYELAALR